MSYWNGKTIIRFTSKKHSNGWWEIDCGCCGGLQWGGNEPRECRDCGGSGVLWWHKKSRVYADYPGGKLKGSSSVKDCPIKENK